MIQKELTDCLIQRLKQQGFTVTVDHYLKMEALLEAAAGGQECPIAELKYLLCPIFALNPKQQNQFYQTFDQYCSQSVSKQVQQEAGRKDEHDETQKPQPLKARRWPYVAAGIVVVLIVFVSVDFTVNWKQDETVGKPGDMPGKGMPGGKKPSVPETPGQGVTQPEINKSVQPKKLTF